MPTDYNQVMEALRKADAAGNIEDATRLAEIANSIKPSSQGEDKGLGAMPFVNKAIAGTIGAPVDLITGGLNLIPGVDIQDPIGGSKSIESGMGAMGINLPEEGREPKTVPEHIGRAVGEASSMLLPAGAGMRIAAKGTGLVANISKTFIKSIAKHPYLAMTSEVTGAMGAGTGRAIGEQEYPESPGAQSTAEIAGGIMGGMAPTAVVHAPSAMILRAGKTLLKKGVMPFTKKGATWRAGEFVKSQVADPAKTAGVIGERTIGDLPPIVASGEKRLVTLYKSLIGQDPKTDFEAIEDLSKSIVKLEKEMRKMGYGSPELLAEITEKRVAAIELRIDNRVLAATERAQQKLDALPVAQRKAQESRIVRNELKSVMESERGKVRELWADVPKDERVGFDNTRTAFSEIKDDLAKAQHDDIPGVLKGSAIINGKKLKSTNVREMQGLRSKLLETARAARKDSQWNKARISENMADAILADLDSAGGSNELRAALTGTKQFKTRFEQGTVGKILGYSRTGAPTIDPDITLDISIGRMGQKGALDIDKIAVTPEAMEATERYLARSYTDHSLNKKTGVLDPIKSEQWVKNNEAILDKFPDLRTQLTDAAGAQELANSTSAAMQTRKAALRNPKISVAAKFMNAANLDKAVKDVFTDDNPVSMAKELVRKATKDTTGDSIAGLRAGFVDYMLDGASKGPFNELGEQTLSGRALLNSMNKNNEVLKQIFTPEQIKRMRQVGAELSKLETFERATAGKPEIEMKDAASSALKLFSRIGGARLGGWIGRESAGGSLQMAQIFSQRMKNFAAHLTKDKATQMINDAILSKDPGLLKALLSPIDKPKVGWKDLVVLDAKMNLWLAGTGKRVMEDARKESIDYIQAKGTMLP